MAEKLTAQDLEAKTRKLNEVNLFKVSRFIDKLLMEQAQKDPNLDNALQVVDP